MKQIEADVYQGNCLVGHFYRTNTGSILEVLSAPQSVTTRPTDFLTTKIAYDQEIVSEGINLPPYFVNLLPEGIRILHLQNSIAYLAKDDLLGLLIRIGRNMIGDIDVVPHKENLNLPTEKSTITTFNELYDDLYLKAGEKTSIAGVQKKISDVSISLLSPRHPNSIIKLDPAEFPGLVLNENFFLRMAGKCGVKSANAKILTDSVGETGLVVQRFDRIKISKEIIKLHQEDMCQLTNAYPSNKYDIPLKIIVEVLNKYTTSPEIETLGLLRMLAFSFMIGNADHHAKNISLLWNLNSTITLTPAYDMLSTLPYRHHDKKMALKMDGKDSNFKSRDFVAFASRYQIPEPATKAMLTKLTTKAAAWIPRLSELPYGAKTIEFLQKEIEARREALIP